MHRFFNLHTLLLFIGFAVGYFTCYSAVIWPAGRSWKDRVRELKQKGRPK